ncbi:MAG: hypothetical protein ABGY75_14150 [Gemmataceae bacterium]
MTEAEWLAAEFFPPMLDHIYERATTRQYLLLGVAFCRRIWERIPFDDCREVVEATERLADHPHVNEDDGTVATDVAMLSAGLFEGYHREQDVGEHTRGAYLAAMACGGIWYDATASIHSIAESAAIAVAGDNEGPEWEAERQSQVKLLQELFGNPFRPVAFDPASRSETAVALAAGIYAERAFDRLPILADALEEAGCDHADVLAHCRGPGPHARGCWVVDRVLGKQ